MSEQQETELAVLREDAAELWNMLAELTGACQRPPIALPDLIERKAGEALKVLNARCYGNIEEYPGFVIYTGRTTSMKPDRPRGSCGCGVDLVWITGEWQHDAAPATWGDDHDADAEPPTGAAREYWDNWDEVDGS